MRSLSLLILLFISVSSTISNVATTISIPVAQPAVGRYGRTLETFDVTVLGKNGTIPVGLVVHFYDHTQLLGDATINNKGKATFTTKNATQLHIGKDHLIQAIFTRQKQFLRSQSKSLKYAVLPEVVVDPTPRTATAATACPACDCSAIRCPIWSHRGEICLNIAGEFRKCLPGLFCLNIIAGIGICDKVPTTQTPYDGSQNGDQGGSQNGDHGGDQNQQNIISSPLGCPPCDCWGRCPTTTAPAQTQTPAQTTQTPAQTASPTQYVTTPIPPPGPKDVPAIALPSPVAPGPGASTP